MQEHFESLRTEFSSEVQLLSKIDHRNLVKLLGYIEKGNERLIITEYVPNGTLREHLDGEISNCENHLFPLGRITLQASHLTLL